MDTLPTWVSKHVEHDILRTPGRYTGRHRTSNHVAILFKGRKVLAIGQNTVGGRNTIHAEAAAIRNLGNLSKLQGSMMVVIRIGKDSSLKNSAPCHDCQRLLQKCQRDYGLAGWIHS